MNKEEYIRFRKQLALKFREARTLLGLSQTKAAEHSGLGQGDISLLETGAKKFLPSPYLLFLYVNNVDLNSLFGEGAVTYRGSEPIQSWKAEDGSLLHAAEPGAEYGDRGDIKKLAQTQASPEWLKMVEQLIEQKIAEAKEDELPSSKPERTRRKKE